MPRIKVNSVEEYRAFERKLEEFSKLIDDEYEKRDRTILTHEYHNYGLSDDIMPGPGCVEDADGIIYKLIDKLDELTNHQNKEWCINRILISVEHFITRDPACYGDLQEIIFEDGGGGGSLPQIYSELSWTNMSPKMKERDEEGCMYLGFIPYYECEKCGEEDDYGEPENSDNRLLCGDCHFEHNNE
tara:strand:- start:120 stop:680 length:561 start_codon:yes stop_codon:yes gene_type:complete